MEPLNYYPSLPEVPYQKTAVKEIDVINYIQGISFFDNTGNQHTPEVEALIRRMVYAVSYNETGAYNALVNTNAAGFQADNSHWRHSWDNIIVATTVKRENMTGKARRFLVFDKWESSIDMLAFYMANRQIYIGADCSEWAAINPVGPARIVKQPGETEGQLLHVDLYTAYLRAWVLGDIKARPKLADIKDFTLLYDKAAKIFI